MAHYRRDKAGEIVGPPYKLLWKEWGWDDDRRESVLRSRSETIRTWREAERRKAEIERADAPTPDRAARRATFGDYAEEWLAGADEQVATGRLKAGTVEEYRGLLRRYVLPEFAGRRITSITPSDAIRFRRELADRGIHHKTVKHGYSVFRRVLAHAIAVGALTENPAVKSSWNEGGDGSTALQFEGTPLSRAQVSAVVAEVAERSAVYALAVRFLASTGLRAAEFAGLDVGDLRLADRPGGGGVKGSVKVVRTRKWKAGECAVGTPKSKKSRRTVPLPSGLARDLRTYLDTVHPRGEDPGAPLWPNGTNERGGRRPKGSRAEVTLDWSAPINTGAFYGSVLRPAYAACGLPITDKKGGVRGVRMHDLRHTYATLQLMAGEPYQRVSRWLGHSSFVVTLTVYAGWIADEDEESSLDIGAPSTPASSVASAELARGKGTNRVFSDAPCDDELSGIRQRV